MILLESGTDMVMKSSMSSIAGIPTSLYINTETNKDMRVVIVEYM